MANIYSGILSSMMGTFASVISNNLNIVMKALAVITIVMSISDDCVQCLRYERQCSRNALFQDAAGDF